MRRYKFLTKDDIYDAFNRLRDAFLAAKNGDEVEEIINPAPFFHGVFNSAEKGILVTHRV